MTVAGAFLILFVALALLAALAVAGVVHVTIPAFSEVGLALF